MQLILPFPLFNLLFLLIYSKESLFKYLILARIMQIIKVPGINGCPSCRTAGNLIIKQLESIINSKGKAINPQSQNLEEIHVDNSNLESQEKLILESSLEAYKTQDKVFFLGGDHSISFPAISSFFNFCDKNSEKPFIIIMDAHLDLAKPENQPDNKSWLRALIEKFGTENILIVGARIIREEEREFFEENKIKIIGIYQFTADLQDTTEFIMEASQGRPLYLSIDMAVVDPLYAPSIEYPEDSGFSSQQILYISRRISMMKNLKAIDIVEISIKDSKETEKTVKLAAKILSEFL